LELKESSMSKSPNALLPPAPTPEVSGRAIPPTPPAISVEEMYRDPALSQEALEAIFSASLHPRAATMLYDKIGGLGLDESHWLLDVGCRDANHTAILVQRYGCHALGIDPVEDHLTRARATIDERDMHALLTVKKGKIELLPTQSGGIDFIWCRDVLNHVADLRKGLQECFRVLRPGGLMLLYQTFATTLLEPAEAVRLYLPMSIVAANMDPSYFEGIAQRVGFQIREKDLVGSEWREYWEEEGSHNTSQKLLRLARLRRQREAYIAKLGRTLYEVELADCHWAVYQMLGKLCPTVYTLEKPFP